MTGRVEGQGRLAIVGLGPRGLGALEALVRQATAEGPGLEVDLFDPMSWPGAGPNFAPDQSPLCRLNIPLRAVRPGASPVAGGGPGGFADWLGADGGDPDHFPARAELGGYLAARMARLVASGPPGLTLTHRPLAVHGIDMAERGQGWLLTDTDGATHGPYAEVLLTQGQPDTAPDKQLARWQDHAAASGATLLPAYPADRLLAAAGDWAGRSVAIRGLGLATLDVLRLLTQGQGGRFEGGRYAASGREPARILPFSRDGLAPVPKPATAALDARFQPREDETAAFRQALAQALRQPDPEAALDRLTEALRGPALRILGETGAAPAEAAGLSDWLAQERAAPGSQERRDTTEALRAGIAEAHGHAAPSAGYVLGQLMRHWQDELRMEFNPAPADPEVASAIIGFDEGLKRYSYGPPVEAAEELLVLIEAGLVDPRAADDPDVRLVADGWQLVDEDATARAGVMIDAVLPAPDLDRVTDPLMRGLIEAGRAVPVGAGLGARTCPDARLLDEGGEAQAGLCLLGRLAQGSVIAVDSIHDCFGAAADRWAEGVLARLWSTAPD